MSFRLGYSETFSGGLETFFDSLLHIAVSSDSSRYDANIIPSSVFLKSIRESITQNQDS